MSVITSVENAVEQVFHEVETVVSEVDGAALAEARRLIAEAKAAEAKVLSIAETYKTEIAAALAKYGPEIVQEGITLAEKLLSDLQGLFGVAAAEKPAE